MRLFYALTTIFTLGISSLAAAESSVIDAYGGEGARVTGSTGGSLPFTGLDLGLMVVGGLLLLSGGIVMRRLSRHRAPSA